MKIKGLIVSSYKDSAPDVEAQILAFPVAVVLFASVSFLFGGCCAPWQWWLATASVLAWPWIAGRNARGALSADIMFLAVLAVFWCIVPLALDMVLNPDSGNYHLPTIRLLARGWNPVRDPDATAILQRLGLEREGMTYFSVAFLPKTAGIFDACAVWFCKDPMSLTFPLRFFLFAGVLLAAIRAFPILWTCGVLSAVALVCFAPPESHVDNCLALASGGLLLTMLENVQTRRLRLLPLSVFSFWMVTLKLPGCVAAFGFWMFFTAVFLFGNMEQAKSAISKFALIAVIIAVTAGISSFNPYGTSFRDHGHPLYPLKTIDPEQHPMRNIAGDCKIGNDDWKSMGYFGCLLNSYGLPRVARAYYNHKLQRNDFAPHQYVWDYSFEDTGKLSPLTLRRRIRIWIPLLVLLVLPGHRFLGAMMVFSLMALPKEYMGIERYYPWIPAFKAVALGLAIEWIAERAATVRKIALVLSAAVLVWVATGWARGAISTFRAKVTETRTPRGIVYACLRRGPAIPLDFPMEGKPRYPEGKTQMNNAILLLDSLGRGETRVASRSPGKTDGLVRTRFGYYIEEDLADPESSYRQPDGISGKFTKICSTVSDYAGILWKRLCCF